MEKIVVLESSLRSLNVSGFDARVYLLCLKNGPLTITDIAYKLSVERATIYVALERLTDAGLIPKNRPSTRGVQVEPPSKIVALLQAKQIDLAKDREQIEQAMPELLAEFSTKSKLSAFRLYEGRDQFLAVFEEVLREAKDEILYYGDAESFFKLEGAKYDKHWLKRRLRRKLPSRMLMLPSAVARTQGKSSKKLLRESRLLGKEAVFKGSIMIYGVKTVFWNPLAERAIVIEDSLITDMLRFTYELAWGKGKKI